MSTQFNLEIPLLRTFVAVANSGSFSAAANCLHCSQPSVSIQVKRLETKLGGPLFERGNQGCKLTEAGRLLLEHAVQALRDHDAVLTRLRPPSSGGVVRLGILDEADPRRVSEILRCFVRLCPRSNLDVLVKPSAELLTEYRRGRLDLIFAACSSIPEEASLVWTEAIAWAGAETMQMTETPVPLIALRDPCAYRSTALTALTSARRPWAIACSSSTMKGVRAAVEAGIGVTVMDHAMIVPPLKWLDLAWSLPKLNSVFVCSYCSNPRFMGVVTALREILSGETERPVAGTMGTAVRT